MIKYLFLVMAVLFPAMCFAQTDESYLRELLKRLDNIRNHQAQSKQDAIRQALTRIQAAESGGGSAMNFYEDAVKATRFEGKRDDAKAFEEWRAKQALAYRQPGVQQAIQQAVLLHLRYLDLSLRWNATEKKETLLPDVKNYLGNLVDAEKTFHRISSLSEEAKKAVPEDVKKLVMEPLTSSMFVRWLHLTEYLPDAANWEMVPGNMGGILDKIVRPELRKTKSRDLIETWNQQILFEADRISAQQLAVETDKFNKERRPQLMWNRAEDIVFLGYNKQGYGEMLVQIEGSSSSADQDKWIVRLQELIAKEREARSSPSPAAPTPSSSPEPSAPTTEATRPVENVEQSTTTGASSNISETRVSTVTASNPGPSPEESMAAASPSVPEATPLPSPSAVPKAKREAPPTDPSLLPKVTDIAAPSSTPSPVPSRDQGAL